MFEYIRQYIAVLEPRNWTPNELGSRVDDGLVEYLYLNLRNRRLRGGDERRLTVVHAWNRRV